VHIHHKNFTRLKTDKTFPKTDISFTDGFNFRTAEDNPGFEFIKDVIAERRLPVNRNCLI